LFVGGGGQVRGFETVDWQERFRLPAGCFAVAAGPNGDFLATWNRDEVVVRRLETMQPFWSFRAEPFQSQSLYGLTLSADGRHAVERDANTMISYDAAHPKTARELYRAHGPFVSLAMSPCAPRVRASNSGVIGVLQVDYHTNNEQGRADASAGVMRQLCYNNEGSLFAGASSDRSVYVWDAETSQLKMTFIGHDQPVNCVAFCPDGKTLASGDDAGIVRLWDLESGRETLRLKAHSLPVKSIAFSPDGRLLATATAYAPGQGEVRIWFADPVPYPCASSNFAGFGQLALALRLRFAHLFRRGPRSGFAIDRQHDVRRMAGREVDRVGRHPRLLVGPEGVARVWVWVEARGIGKRSPLTLPIWFSLTSSL
jgi:WD40 repeat protein